MRLLEEKNKLKLSLFFFSIATITALISASIRISADLSEFFQILTPSKWPKIFYPALIDEFTGVYTFWLLVPAIIAFFNKFPFKKGNLAKLIPFYILFSILIGLTHTGMMYISRSIIYPALNMGNYNYGYIPFRILMEYLKQFIIFWSVFLVYTIIKMNREKEAHRIKTIQLEEQLTKARLETLKMQLNPHFLFNTLNMISSTMYENLETADKMIANLSDLLRITLKSSGKGENTLESEIQILNLYVEIMKARFKEKLEVKINTPENVLNALVPNFLFQPLVENSIKYGMENLSTTKIDLSIKRVDEKLYMQINDNGPGIKEEPEKILNSGVGLSNTYERLEKLYGNNFEFILENLSEGGLAINISIPFKETID